MAIWLGSIFFKSKKHMPALVYTIFFHTVHKVVCGDYHFGSYLKCCIDYTLNTGNNFFYAVVTDCWIWNDLFENLWVFSLPTQTHTYIHKHIHTLQTFRHGFPSQPTCLAYDPVQQLLAIGTENGTVLLYPTAAIGQMRHIIDNY